MHPAIVAQAAATAAVQLEGRFTLGVGTGEALNEHILGDRWPSEDVRLEMLEEAVERDPRAVAGRVHLPPRPALHGRERAHLHPAGRSRRRSSSRAFGPKSFDLALRIGDGFITTQPDAERVQEWKAKAGADKPTQAGYKVCVADTEDEGVADRAPAVGQRRAARASSPRSCRRPSTSSRPASWSPRT